LESNSITKLFVLVLEVAQLNMNGVADESIVSDASRANDEQSASNAPTEKKKSLSVGGLFVRLGASLLHTLEAVGETVADVLGLDEPKFQYVVDSMTEQELEEARKVHELRNAGRFRLACFWHCLVRVCFLISYTMRCL
jgi:hypothetical protein